MASTEITTVDAGGYLALNHDLVEVKSFIEDNLAGQDVSEFDLQRLNVPSGKAQKYRWEIPTLEGSEAVDEISGIIVFQKQTRAFWPQSIDDGGGNVPPSCSSPDAKFGFGKQWATATDPDPDGEPRRWRARSARTRSSAPTAAAARRASRPRSCSCSWRPASSRPSCRSRRRRSARSRSTCSRSPTPASATTRSSPRSRWRRRPTRAAPSTRRSPAPRRAPRPGGRQRARAYGETLRPTFEAAATAPIQTPEEPPPRTGRNGTEAATES
jgi:hypothetical protein